MIVLALGSNLGDREATIRAAVHDINAIDGVKVVAASTLVETEALTPNGVDADAPAYLNAAIAVRTALSPHELLSAVAAIELAHGRVRAQHWGDRTLDIDIITFDEHELDSDALTIPHPRAASRAFVLAPWVQLDPQASLAGHGPVADLLATLAEPAHYAAEPLL